MPGQQNINTIYQTLLQQVQENSASQTTTSVQQQPMTALESQDLVAPQHNPSPGISALSQSWQSHSSSLEYIGNNILGSKMKPPKKAKKGQKIYNLPLIEAFPRQLNGKEQSGEIGLEIECEGKNLFDSPIQYWNIHQDGSLRAVEGHPPLEYTLRKPLDRSDVTKALKYLSSKLKASGSEIVQSTRTSVHVHFNCQQLTIKDVYKFWCMYAIFEEMLIDFSGDDRKGNLFCLSGKQAEYNVHLLEQSIRSEDFNELFNDNLRYTSCNFASLGKFGSLEFRSLRGTTDLGVINTWLDLLYTLKDKALGYEDPRDIVKEFLEIGPEAFLYRVFGHRQDLLNVFRNRNDRVQSMWDGMRMMRDVAYAIRWLPFDASLKEKKDDLDDVLSSDESPESTDNMTSLHHVTYDNPDTELLESHRMYCRRTGELTDVFFSRYASGNYYLENYTGSRITMNPFRSNVAGSWYLNGRMRYRVNPELEYSFIGRTDIGEDEVAPDEL